MTSSICEPLAIVTSHWFIILTLHLWTLSSSQWRCQPGRFGMAAHRHDRRGIYRCVLLRLRGRIEIDHSYGLRWSGLCCNSRHSTRPRDDLPHECCAGSDSTNHSSADRIVVNSYNPRPHTPLGQPATESETPLQNTLVGNANTIQGISIATNTIRFSHRRPEVRNIIRGG